MIGKHESHAAKRSDEPAPKGATAVEKLAAFERQHLPDSPRIGGKIEKGHGSHISRLSPDLQQQHAAIEALVDAEGKVADAHKALADAEQAKADAEKHHAHLSKKV